MNTISAARLQRISIVTLAILGLLILIPTASAAPASPPPYIPDPVGIDPTPPAPPVTPPATSPTPPPTTPEPGIIDPWAEEDARKAKEAKSFLGQVGGGVTAAGGAAGMKNTTPANIVGRLIKWAMELIGVVMVALIMYGGVLWMTAQGSDEKIKKARNILTSATVGLAIVLAGWSITSIIIRAITTATAPSSASEIIDPWANE